MTDTVDEMPTPPGDGPWWKNEDWLAVAGAAPLVVAIVLGVTPRTPSFSWSGAAELSRVFGPENLGAMLVAASVFVVVSTVVLAGVLGRDRARFVPGAIVIVGLAFFAQWLAGHALPKRLGLEHVIFALCVGLAIGNTVGAPRWLGLAVRTELYIKIGVVLLGATIRFPELVRAGGPAMLQAALVIPLVWHVCFRLARRLRVDDELGVMLATAVSICGVSAAIAACGAIRGDRKKLS